MRRTRGSARERANSSLRPKARSHAVAEELEKAMSRCKRRNGRTGAVRSSCETRTSTWTSTWTSTKWPRKRWTLRRKERADLQQAEEEHSQQQARTDKEDWLRRRPQRSSFRKGRSQDKARDVTRIVYKTTDGESDTHVQRCVSG